MKKLLILILGALLYSKTLDFILPTTILENNSSNIQKKDTNITNTDLNITDTNTTDANNTEIVTEETDFNDTYVTIKNKVNIAIIINKAKFFKYLPSLINSLNAYFIQKNIDFNISLYNIDQNISQISQHEIIYISTDTTKLNTLKDYNKTFYFPLINNNDTNITSNNFYFGGIDFKTQINKLSQFIDDKTDIITDKTLIAKKLLSYEQNLSFLHNIYNFPNIYYKDLNNSFVIFNTSSAKTAQVLSKITQKNINTKLILAPQINYSPLMISLTQPKDIEKLIIANSIINPPILINEYANLINSDIKYNWLNYSTCILANKTYNIQNSLDNFYMSDFNIYIFNNQINYKTKLYIIVNGAFRNVK